MDMEVNFFQLIKGRSSMLKTETNHQTKELLSEGEARLSEILDGKARNVVEVDH